MPRFLLPELFLLFLSLLLLLLPELIEAQRSRFTFGRFQLDFTSPILLTCSTGGDSSAAWDETAENIRSGAEKCLRTVQCPALDDQTPYYVGLGNVQCVNRDDGTVGMDFIGGGAMDFQKNGTVPSLDEDLVEACVRTVLQSSECMAILATYDSRIASPAIYTTGRQYPDVVLAPPAFSGGVSDGAVSAKEEDSSTSSNPTPMMTFPVLGIAGACFVAVLLLGLALFAVFLYQKRRRQKRKDGKHQNENDFPNTDFPFDIETALSRSDSLGQTVKLKGGELGRMLDEQSAVIKTTTASATTLLPHQDDHTPTTIKEEADASIETTSSYEGGEQGLYETVEVGLRDDVGPYDTGHVNTGLDHNDDGLPVILIPDKSTAFVDSAHLCTLQSFQLIPFAETKSDDEDDENHNEQQLTSTPPGQTEHDTTRNFCVISASNLISSSTDLPELAQSSSDDSRLVSRPSNGESYESSKVEIILNDDGHNDDDCESTATPTDHQDDNVSTDYEFEPDGYWDPDDNSISTADAAGLSAMGTGEFSFQPSTTTTTRKITSTTVSSHPTNNESPPPHEKTTLYNWLCEGPVLCTSSSTSSLPDLLAKQPTSPNTDSRVVGRPRTNSYHGISPHTLSATTGV